MQIVDFSELVILLLLSTMCVTAVIHTVAEERRKTLETRAAADGHCISATTYAMQVQHFEHAFQLYLENNLVNAPTEDIIRARAEFEAMFDLGPKQC